MDNAVSSGQVQVFISSTSDLNRFGNDLADWMNQDAQIRTFFKPFYYTRHTPDTDEPEAVAELDTLLRASRLFIALLSARAGTPIPATLVRRLLRRPSETFVEYEHRRAKELQLETRRFRYGTPESNGRWAVAFADTPDLVQKAKQFLQTWIARQLTRASWLSTPMFRRGVVLLLVLATIAALLGLLGTIGLRSALGGTLVPLLTATMAILYSTSNLRHP